MTKIGFNKLKLKRIYAHVYLRNKASCRVLEKNNFKLEGTLRKNALKDGKYLNTFIYAKVK